ncbi:hypothetical protein LX32DRAFT_636864 [Colletotrichum zoysiae]|uniref:Uncharacterized protein n=1 Tax=Colletotrichum zoysiae TaxID=1216348 RepID=A0AAD9M3J7_9PEZI|nr:hypothetical protein LX32DRAFT_636864 [Colletotrichum zoysiae]
MPKKPAKAKNARRAAPKSKSKAAKKKPAANNDSDDDVISISSGSRSDRGEAGDGDAAQGHSSRKRKASPETGPKRQRKTIGEQLDEEWDEGEFGGEARKFVEANYSPKTLEQLDEMLPEEVEHDEDWGTTDEQDLQDSWAADPERPSLVGWEKKDTPYHLLKLWKVCVLLCDRTPRQLISIANHLEYDTINNLEIEFEDEEGGTVRVKSSAWTQPFCLALTQFMFHPVFRGNARLIVTALQYASMIRTNERQDWPLTNPTGEPFFDALIDVINEHRGLNEEPASLRRKAVDVLKANGMSPPLFESFMSVLEDVCSDSKTRRRKGGKHLRTYKVSNNDLTNIRNAVESMTHMGMPLWALNAKTYDAYGTKGRSQEGVPTKDNLNAYQERDILAERRRIAKEKNRQDRLTSPSPEPEPPKHFWSKAEIEDLRAGQGQTDETLRGEIRRLRAELRSERESRLASSDTRDRGQGQTDGALRGEIRRLLTELQSSGRASSSTRDDMGDVGMENETLRAQLREMTQELNEKTQELNELRERMREKSKSRGDSEEADPFIQPEEIPESRGRVGDAEPIDRPSGLRGSKQRLRKTAHRPQTQKGVEAGVICSPAILDNHGGPPGLWVSM